MRVIALIFIFYANALFAQGSIKATNGSGAILRTLDRISGQVKDYQLENGEIFEWGNMSVLMRECRYPSNSIDNDAFAFLTVSGKVTERIIFDGWMIASSPALSALEHPRYDVWVLKCLPYLKGNFMYQSTF